MCRFVTVHRLYQLYHLLLFVLLVLLIHSQTDFLVACLLAAAVFQIGRLKSALIRRATLREVERRGQRRRLRSLLLTAESPNVRDRHAYHE